MNIINCIPSHCMNMEDVYKMKIERDLYLSRLNVMKVKLIKLSDIFDLTPDQEAKRDRLEEGLDRLEAKWSECCAQALRLKRKEQKEKFGRVFEEPPN